MIYSGFGKLFTELKLITFPSKKEVVLTASMVLVVVMFFTIFITAVDLFVSTIVKLFLGL